MRTKPKEVAAQVAALLGDDAIRPSRTPGAITILEYAAHQHISDTAARTRFTRLVAQGQMRRFRFRMPNQSGGVKVGFELVNRTTGTTT